MPPDLAAAGDPEDVTEGEKGALRRVRIGGLAVIDEQHPAALAHLFHAVGKAGEERMATAITSGARPAARGGGEGGGGVLGIVHAAQGGNAGEGQAEPLQPAFAPHDVLAITPYAVFQRAGDGHRHHMGARATGAFAMARE